MKIKRILGAATLIVGFLILLAVSSYLLIPKDNTAAAGMEEASANGILGEKANTIDVIVLGDSESFAAISPMQIWESTGYTSYVCGTSSQKLTYSTTMLKRALQKQKPKIVILETLAIYRKITLGDIALNELSNVFPVFRYHDRWKSVKPNDFGKTISATWTNPNKGFMINKTIKPCESRDYMAYKGVTSEAATANFFYLNRIKKICDENGAELILLSTPSPVNWNDARHRGTQALAEKLGCSFIDLNLMNDQVKIDWSQDTRDAGDHLNNSGATKVTSFLSDYLSGRGILSDHRGDQNYAHWDQGLAKLKADAEGTSSTEASEKAKSPNGDKLSDGSYFAHAYK